MGPEYREEPCRSALNRVKGMAFEWSLNPYMGCVHRCTFCYVRAFERRADRPVRRPLRHLDPRQGQRRRGPPPRARPALLGARAGRDRRRHRPLPARRGALPPDPRLHRGARRGPQPVQHHHARADDRPRHRRPRRGRAARERLGHLLDPDARRGRLAEDRALDRPSAPAAEGRLEARRRRASRPASAWRRSSLGSPTARSSSPRSSRPRARPARRASGRTSSSCARERASTSSSTSPQDWPELVPHYERAVRGARLPRLGRGEAGAGARCRRSPASRESAIVAYSLSRRGRARAAPARSLRRGRRSAGRARWVARA